jgi:hypothetical protein
MPRVDVQEYRISQRVAGANMFLGFSHMSDAGDKSGIGHNQKHE